MIKILKLTLVFFIFYQNSSYSKSTTFDNLNSKNISNYFSGIVANENRKNTEALRFFNLSKVLLNEHDPYLKRYVTTLVLEKKISQAINIIKRNKGRENINFFDAYLLLILDSLKKNDIEKAYRDLDVAFKFTEQDRFNSVILETLKQYLIVFK